MKRKSVAVFMMACFFVLFAGGNAYCEQKSPAFRDIKGSFAEESIIQLVQEGILRGVNAEEFDPGNPISRLDFAVVMAKTLGIQPFFQTEPTFSDIPSGTAEAGYVEALGSLGLIKGNGNKTFGGESPVLRQDVAVIIHRALGEEIQGPPLEGKYTDADQISPYAVDSVAYVTDKGWMTGSEECFYPSRELTRAEAAVLAGRLLKTRKSQARTVFQESPQLLKLGTGEAREIDPRPAKTNLSFTPVYGTDSSAIFTVSPEGTLISGNQPGTGTVTANAGINSYPIKVDLSIPVNGEELPPVNIFTPDQPGQETDLGANCTVEEQAPDPGFKNTEYKNHSGPVEGLASKSEAWTGFLRQQGRDIIADLSSLRAVSSISMEFNQDANSGVFLPKYIKGAVSADGVAWYQLGYAYHGVDPSDSKVQNVKLTLTFPPVTTRYIKISFPVDVWVLARHLSIKGGEQGAKPVILAPAGPDTSFAGNYPQTPNIRDILLIYTGDKSDQQTLTGSDFLPLVTYLDSEGLVKGRMFDTMLFLPQQELPCTKGGWESYLDDLFAPGKQLYALEEAAAKMNTTPGLQEKEKVILTIPYPDSNQWQFGKLEKRGDSLSFSEAYAGRQQAAHDRLSAVQWYYDLLMKKWNNAGFKYLDLAGIYWYKESIDKTVPGEEDLVKNVARLVRGNGQDFFWIPFLGAEGYEDWQSYGFTNVFLQLNYYTAENPPDGRMENAAELARRYQTGIELECDDRMLTTRFYYDVFYKEMEKAHQLGLDGESTNAYYTGLKNTLLGAVHSDNPQIRGIYDDIYRWISGTYN